MIPESPFAVANAIKGARVRQGGDKRLAGEPNLSP